MKNFYRATLGAITLGLKKLKNMDKWMGKHEGASKVFELAILTAILIAAVFIGIRQNSINEAIYQTTDKQTEINEQLRDLNFLVNLQPVLTAYYDSSSLAITFSNFGKLPIFIDTTRIVRSDSSKATDSCNLLGVDRTIPAGESESFRVLDNYPSLSQSLVAGDFFVPFSYQIFFQVVGVPQIYIGEIILFFDKDGGTFRFSRDNPNIPPGVYLQQTNYTDFHKLYEEKICPQK